MSTPIPALATHRPALSALGCAALAFLVVGLAQPAPALANKPLVGVSCRSGFFVRAPTKKIYWIHGDPLERSVAYEGGGRLAALAECGPGVVAVFDEGEGSKRSRVYYSSDCLNLGAEAGRTAQVLAADDVVKSVGVDGAMLTIVLGSGTTYASPVCTP